jgi:hypothetical protein
VARTSRERELIETFLKTRNEEKKAAYSVIDRPDDDSQAGSDAIATYPDKGTLAIEHGDSAIRRRED